MLPNFQLGIVNERHGWEIKSRRRKGIFVPLFCLWLWQQWLASGVGGRGVEFSSLSSTASLVFWLQAKQQQQLTCGFQQCRRLVQELQPDCGLQHPCSISRCVTPGLLKNGESVVSTAEMATAALHHRAVDNHFPFASSRRSNSFLQLLIFMCILLRQSF